MHRHGRDNKIIFWQLAAKDESLLDKILPIDDPHLRRAQPWILHMLPVNAMNFCSFAICKDEIQESAAAEVVKQQNNDPEHHPVLIAIPNTLDSDGVSHTLPSPQAAQSNEILDRHLPIPH